MRKFIYGLGSLIIFGLFCYLLSPLHLLFATWEGVYQGAFSSPNYPETKLSFVGDIFLGRDVEVKMSYLGKDYPFLGDPVSANELRVANFEASVPQVHKPTPAGSFHFSVPEASIPALVGAGFTYTSLANNHSLDNGYEGLQNTVETLSSNGMTPFGELPASFTAAISLGEDYVVAVTGFNDVTKRVTPDLIEQRIGEVSEQSKYQIAYVHWGDEYELEHNARQEYLAKQMIDAGYDAVIGHHPHVVQDIGRYQGAPIFYSLGNYIFDQYFSNEVQMGLRLTMSFGGGGVLYELHPVTSRDTHTQPNPLAGEEKNEFLTELAERSGIVIENGQIKQQI